MDSVDPWYRQAVRAPVCVACHLPVLELLGQSAVLPSYVIQADSPPPETAGTWHLSCLRSNSVGGQWALALERNYIEVRGYSVQARLAGWSVLLNPVSGDVIGLCHQGGTLPLRGQGPVLSTPMGKLAFQVRDEQFWLEWDQPLLATIQEHLRHEGSMPVAAVARLLGMEHRLSEPDMLATAAFRFDDEMASNWQPTVVGAAVSYSVHVPHDVAAAAGLASGGLP